MRRSCAAALLLGIGVLAGCVGHPSDATLEREFAERRVRFDTLAALAAADTALWRVADDWYRTRGGENRYAPSALLPEERWARYRGQFRALDLRDGVSISPGVVEFHRSSRGLGVSGSGKGFAYAPDERAAAPRCASLDDPPRGSICYKRLGREWFLYYDQT